jgi:hypothetical protein
MAIPYAYTPYSDNACFHDIVDSLWMRSRKDLKELEYPELFMVELQQRVDGLKSVTSWKEMKLLMISEPAPDRVVMDACWDILEKVITPDIKAKLAEKGASTVLDSVEGGIKFRKARFSVYRAKRYMKRVAVRKRRQKGRMTIAEDAWARQKEELEGVLKGIECEAEKCAAMLQDLQRKERQMVEDY